MSVAEEDAPNTHPGLRSEGVKTTSHSAKNKPMRIDQKGYCVVKPEQHDEVVCEMQHSWPHLTW